MSFLGRIWKMFQPARKSATKKSASIIKTTSNYWIYSQSKTTVGLGVASPPFIKMALDVAPEQLVNNLFIALDKSGNIVPHPKDWKASEKEFHYMGSKCSGVSEHDNTIVLTPMERVGNMGAFIHSPALDINVSRSESVEKIFEAIKEVFERSK